MSASDPMSTRPSDKLGGRSGRLGGMAVDRERSWPALPVADWQDTRDTLQLWTQVVGKTRLALAPPLNHWWGAGTVPWGVRSKASNVHLFWRAFDLAVTRFSGRPAPQHPGGIPHCPDRVRQEAYHTELSSCGYWPGRREEGLSYSYAYPAPAGFAEHGLQTPRSGLRPRPGRARPALPHGARGTRPRGAAAGIPARDLRGPAELARWPATA